ncbi:MAG: hypothetical protein LBL94_08280 [Prevotellaceae bacterium]|nr:hypothetical protein [Prevotellaceae bacterium]
MKPTGSIFLHCDWHADAYIRVEILDKVFGKNNFRNEIIWCYAGPANVKNRLAQKHDMIYFYSKTENYYFDGDSIRLPYNEETIARTSRGVSSTGIMANVKGDISERHKNRLNEKGKFPEDYWTDIPRLQGNSVERIGYPTQKPFALLERIIKMASNEGDLILDPFMGGGTTLAVADKLDRKWIGIDQSVQAVKVTELRLNQQTDLFTSIYANSYTLQLHKYDYDALRSKDAFEFESWIIGQLGGAPHSKKGGDAGVDGAAADGAPVQVKRSEGVGVNVVKNFSVSAKQFDKARFDKSVKAGKPAGYIIAFSFGKGAVQEAARLKNQENIIIELVPVDTIIPVSKKPSIRIEVNELSRDAGGIREIEFIASGQSAAGIEFYSWDFDYAAEKGFRASVIIDREGRQTAKLKAGLYNIAVKVVDNDGLENVETIKLKVNGTVERTE